MGGGAGRGAGGVAGGGQSGSGGILRHRWCPPDPKLQPVLEVQTSRCLGRGGERLRRFLVGQRGPAAFVQSALLHGADVYAGYGWYRKHFAVPASWSGKSVFLEFQAAFQQAQIYVNGKQVGQHIGGYNGFSIDITSAISDGDNVVAVRLNNNWNAQIPPISGDHTFQGGLYSDVFAVITDPLHITWYGTWVTTPTLATNSGSSSTVEIKTEVQNSRSAAVNATLKTDIVDNTGKVVTTISSQQQIAAGATVTSTRRRPRSPAHRCGTPTIPRCTRRFPTFPTARGTWTPSQRRSGSAGSVGRGRKASR